jgi:SAM-dependent methyltransferase
MAHPQQIEFCFYVKNKFCEYFTNKNVLDCGSLDINGNNRYLFDNCKYLGIDVGEGKNVDIVTPIHEFEYLDESFDTIISTECFEHDMYYKQSLNNIVRLLKSGGLFLFTCATTGRPEHGTRQTTQQDSPLTSSITLWCDYKNLEEKDIREAIDVDEIFIEYEFKTRSNSSNPFDLYFYGIKK